MKHSTFTTASGNMKILVSGILFLTLLAIMNPAYSGNIPGLRQDYSVRTWTSDNGLPVNSIRAIAQTPDGFIWLATEEGLVRFDGMNFYTFNPTNNATFVDKDVHSLHIFKDSSLISIVSLHELTGSLAISLGGDADWRSFYLEGYLFIGLIYWVFCFGMSASARHIEQNLQARS